MKNKSIGIMQANLTVLRYHGLWSTYLNGKKDRYSRLKLFLAFSATSLLWYGSTSHLVNIIIAKQQNVTTEILEHIAIFLSCTSVLYVFFLFLYKRHDIADLIQELQNYGVFGKPVDAENVDRTFNFYTKLYYCFCLLGASCFFTFNQTVGVKQCREKNNKINRNEVCGLFTHMWLPFDYNFTPAYEIMAVLQCIEGLYAAPILSVFFTVVVMLQHLICRIRHLKQMAKEVFKVHDLFIQKQRLITCIRYHQYIIRLSDTFNDCFGQISFLYITLGAAVLSVTCYQSLREVSVGSLLHLAIWLLTIAVICAAGQQLIDESESVAIAFYNLQWTNASIEIKFMLKFIVMRAQKPLSLRAFSFGEMSLATLMAIIKSAYRYVTLMKQMS